MNSQLKRMQVIQIISSMVLVVSILSALILVFSDAGKFSSPIAIIIISISISAFILTGVWDQKIRAKIIGVLFVYLSLILTFGAGYHIVFIHDPTNFSFSTLTREGKTSENWQNEYLNLQHIKERLYCAEILFSKSSSAFRALRAGDSFKLDSTRHISITSRTFGIYPAGAASVLDFTVYKIDGAFLLGSGNSDELAAARAMINSTDVESFRAALNHLINSLIHQHQEALHKLTDVIGRHPEWEILDFIYFSSVTITTLGYGDILPNSRLTRIITMTQTISGVFFLAFIIGFLWPGNKE